MRNRIRSVILLSLPIIVTILLSYYLQITIISDPEKFKNWFLGFGPFVVLVYIILQSIAVIFAPIGGLFLVVTMVAVFGPEIATILAYSVTTPVYLLNFYIARRFGRPLVERIVGKLALEKADHFVKDAGVFTLIVLRIFQSGNFDYLAYGLGLTKVPFKTFAIVNFLAGIPAALVFYFVITRFSNITISVVVFYLVAVVFAGISIYINHKLRKK